MPRTPKCLYPGMTGPWVNGGGEKAATPTMVTPSSSTPSPSSSTPVTSATAGPTTIAQTPPTAETDTKGEASATEQVIVREDIVRTETPPVPDDLAPTEDIVNNENLRRCVAMADAEILYRTQLNRLWEEVRTSLECDRLKRKAELDEFFEKLERERDEDRRIEQQRHAETQAKLQKLANILETLKRQQEVLMQRMGNGRNRRTPNPQTPATGEDSPNDREASQENQ